MKKYTNTRAKLTLIKKSGKFLPVYTIIVLIMAWEGAVRFFSIQDYILPAPSSIAAVLLSMKELILSHTVVTVSEALAGFAVSIALGLILSFIMYRWKLIERMFYPLMVISQAIPIIALAPLILIWFGVGILPKILIVILVCFFPLCVSTLEGLKSVDKDMVNLMKVMGAGQFKIFRSVSLPSALPQFFAGLKISAAYSIMGAVIGEWLGAKAGLGILMTRTISSHRTDMLFAAIVVVIILSIGIFNVIVIIEKIATPWNFRKTNTGS